jgi:hypothetical protein
MIIYQQYFNFLISKNEKKLKYCYLFPKVKEQREIIEKKDKFNDIFE